MLDYLEKISQPFSLQKWSMGRIFLDVKITQDHTGENYGFDSNFGAKN